PFTPTVTASGHTSIYTGSVPAISGITGNLWWDRLQQRSVYCTEDTTVQTVGNINSTSGQQSPRNLFVTTICDELKLATNFQSKTIGIAIKDRGGILPAGQSANAAYWYDTATGDWITSTFYMKELPQWVKNFNAKKLVDKYYAQGWTTLYPLNTYTQSSADEEPYETKPLGKGFPYDLKKFTGKNYYRMTTTPFGNTFTFEIAKEALTAEQLGADSITDFLALSISSTDLIGHAFGPNSIEQEDDFLRLDKDLGEFLDFLDNKVGKGQYLIFLSADHGVAHAPGFLKEHKISAGNYDTVAMMGNMNKALKEKFGADELVVSLYNYQVHLNHPVIISSNLNEENIKEWIIDYLSKQPAVARVFDIDKLMQTTLNAKIRDMLANGYYPNRNGDVQIILQPQWIEGFTSGGTTHGVWNPYDAHIPLLWYGWNIKAGKTNREIYMTDIAPTLAALLHIQMPSGSIGHVIEEIVK
ncbi:MAG: alkaline phosphatase family protein, partial [Bacteroidota bacterium]|nr:alkaline phosphatase family protein [Bacteroidota bacterium]